MGVSTVTVHKRETKTVVTVYIASDGTEFTTEKECKLHEWKEKATKVYIPVQRGSQRLRTLEVYSTRDKAILGSNTEEPITVEEIYVDNRLALVEQ